MNILEQSCHVIEPKYSIKDIYSKLTWLLAHNYNCYLFDTDTDDDLAKLAEQVSSRHCEELLQHGIIYLHCSYMSPLMDTKYLKKVNMVNRYRNDPNSYVNKLTTDYYKTDCYITTTLGVMYEHKWMDDIQYITDATEYHDKMLTIEFGCDLMSAYKMLLKLPSNFYKIEALECMRHSWFAEPEWEGPDGLSSEMKEIFKASCVYSELSYNRLRKLGCHPRQAKLVGLSASIVQLYITGRLDDWKEFAKKGIISGLAEEISKY